MRYLVISDKNGNDLPVRLYDCQDAGIKSIGHDEGSQRLIVHFANGLLHIYHGVPVRVFELFCTAPSKADFWRDHLRRGPAKFGCIELSGGLAEGPGNCIVLDHLEPLSPVK